MFASLKKIKTMKYIFFSLMSLFLAKTSNAQTVPDSVSNTQKVTLTTHNKTTRSVKKIDKPEKVLVAPPHKEIRKED
jgi:hypothetical protein